MFHLSSMYASIFLTRDEKGLTCVPHGLHMDDCVAWSFLKLCIPLKALTVTSTSSVSSNRLQWRNPYKKMHSDTRSQAISGRISGLTYTISGGLLEANVNQVIPCFNRI